jgi:hypothetical protein
MFNIILSGEYIYWLFIGILILCCVSQIIIIGIGSIKCTVTNNLKLSSVLCDWTLYNINAKKKKKRRRRKKKK